MSAVIPNYNFYCTFLCDENGAISGPSILCNVATYSIGSPSITNIDWDIIPANAGTLTFISTTEVQVTINNSYIGFATLEATVDSDRCDNNIVLTKTIHFGSPSTSGSVLTSDGGGSLNPGPTDAIVFSISTQNINSWTHINWTVFSYSIPNTSQYFSIQTQGNGVSAVVSADEDTPTGNYIAPARVTNACGFLPFDINFTVEDSGPPVISRMSNNYKVYPNPSKNIINIDLIQGTKK